MLKLNHKRGYRRLTLVLSFTLAIITFFIYISAQYRVDEEEIVEGIFAAIIVFIGTWIYYLAIAFIVRGFRQVRCSNCEKVIKTPNNRRQFKEYTVCQGCYEKLNAK